MECPLSSSLRILRTSGIILREDWTRCRPRAPEPRSSSLRRLPSLPPCAPPRRPLTSLHALRSKVGISTRVLVVDRLLTGGSPASSPAPGSAMVSLVSMVLGLTFGRGLTPTCRTLHSHPGVPTSDSTCCPEDKVYNLACAGTTYCCDGTVYGVGSSACWCAR